MKEQKGERLIFTGGAARSGTTLVQNILDSHPDIVGGPEFLHLEDLMDFRKKVNISIDRGVIDLICSKKALENHLGEMLEKIFLPLADAGNTKFYSEKTPGNVLIFDELLEIFPKARCFHVVRDPRGTVSSMLEVGKRALKQGKKTPKYTHDIVESMAYLKKCFKAGFDAQHKHPNHIMMVTYENLIARPETVTKQMCAFLGIKWSEKMLMPGDFSHMGSKAIVNNIWYTESMYNRNPDPGEMEKWRFNLSPAQVNYICRQLLEDENLKLACPDELKDMKLHGAVISGSLGSMRYRLRHWLKNDLIPIARQKIKNFMEIMRNRQPLMHGLKKN